MRAADLDVVATATVAQANSELEDARAAATQTRQDAHARKCEQPPKRDVLPKSASARHALESRLGSLLTLEAGAEMSPPGGKTLLGVANARAARSRPLAYGDTRYQRHT
jgi:hypothetical protein